MHILIVSQYFWPESFRINDLALGLVQRDHKVTVLTGLPNYPQGRLFPGYSYGSKDEFFGGIKIIRVPLIPRQEGRVWHLALNYCSFLIMAAILGPIYCRGKFDAIFVAQYSPVFVGIPAVVLKAIKRIPIFFWIQDLWPESLTATGAIRNPSVINVVDRIIDWIYRHCDQILVQSKGFISHLAAKGISTDIVRYLPNWAEDVYRPVQVEDNDGIREILPEGFCIIFAGNIGEAQGFSTILTAAELLKLNADIHWVILGDGRAKAWVKEQIETRSLNDSVHLLGRFPMEDMPTFFAAADALLVTLKNEEIFSLTIPGKVQSYMACGKPIIACLAGEGAQVIRESGAGLCGSPEDARQLADNVLTLYRMSSQERHEMGVKGRQYYDANFDRDMLIDKLERWLKAAVNENAGGKDGR